MTGLRDKPRLAAPLPPPLRAARAEVAGIGVATPDLCESQAAIGEQFANLWNLRGAAANRWRRIIAGSQIDTRSAVIPIADVPRLSTGERMRLYERHAPDLAADAARIALAHAGVDPGVITDLIIVTCTGFAAPGVDVEIVTRLGLSPAVRRSTIGFMGCFGAITGLRAALGACAAMPGGVALVVCVELCSLHLRAEADVQNQVASALFADGAAAVVMRNVHHDGASRIDVLPPLTITHPGSSRLINDHRDDMSWRITDAGFAMTLSPRVPAALRAALPEFLATQAPAPKSIALHPGGAAIINAAADALAGDSADDIADARLIMRRHGNMSSPTVLFVLKRLLERSAARPITLLAFGPGLTLDSITLE